MHEIILYVVFIFTICISLLGCGDAIYRHLYIWDTGNPNFEKSDSFLDIGNPIFEKINSICQISNLNHCHSHKTM